jgi:Ras-related protein Rab-21
MSLLFCFVAHFPQGNKSDMEKTRTVDHNAAERCGFAINICLTLLSYATSVGAVHFNTSAKLNRGIEEMFFDLSKRKPMTFPSL